MDFLHILKTFVQLFSTENNKKVVYSPLKDWLDGPHLQTCNFDDFHINKLLLSIESARQANIDGLSPCFGVRMTYQMASAVRESVTGINLQMFHWHQCAAIKFHVNLLMHYAGYRALYRYISIDSSSRATICHSYPFDEDFFYHFLDIWIRQTCQRFLTLHVIHLTTYKSRKAGILRATKNAVLSTDICSLRNGVQCPMLAKETQYFCYRPDERIEADQ